ncbi:MAG: radical SAM protein, partial [Clostridia bacterium]
MKKYSKAYIEITNVCNLSCRFCPKTKRKPQMMSVENFQKVIFAIDNLTDYVYFHVLGEPTIHPDLAEFVKIANAKNKKITITTNGTNLSVLSDILESQPLYKVNISLQAVGGNDGIDVQNYMKNTLEFAQNATEKGVIVVLRLWNEGSEFNRNNEIIAEIESRFGKIEFGEKDSVTLSKRLFLERADEFQWRCDDEKTTLFCYGLRDQFAILVDGTV